MLFDEGSLSWIFADTTSFWSILSQTAGGLILFVQLAYFLYVDHYSEFQYFVMFHLIYLFAGEKVLFCVLLIFDLGIRLMLIAGLW